jgi:hypothetical protein
MTMISLEEVILEAQKNGRVCLLPSKWNELYQLLPEKRQIGAGWEPALPLILAAWYEAPTLMKKLRMVEHLEWAARHGCLERVYGFLRGLAENEWYHSGE